MQQVGWYTGQFLPENEEWLQPLLQGSWQSLTTRYIEQLVADSVALICRRPMPELHKIAVRMELAIRAEAARQSRKPSPDLDSVDLLLLEEKRAWRRSAEAQERRGAFYRRIYGDIDLWLAGGAEHADPDPHLADMPQDISRSECLAAMAVWKAVDLNDTMRQVLERVRQAPGAVMHGAAADGDALRAVTTHPLMQGMALMQQVAQLTADVTRAATMALDVQYLDEELAKARADGAAERERALLDARDLHVREAGARGGAMRAAKFEPAKRRAIELYSAPDAKYRSRTAAAEAIARILEAEGLHSKFDFVHQTLKDHDRAIQEARAKRGLGGADPGV